MSEYARTAEMQVKGRMEQIIQWIQESFMAFPSIGIADILDILIMAFIFYKLLMIVRRTSSGQVMKGVLLVIVAFVLVSAFQLRMLSYLMGKVLEYGVLALVILFQPEIRRFLEQMGRSNMSKSIADAVTGRDRDEERQRIRKAINAIVDGVGILQQLKMGALIVFERQTKLGEIIETGTKINCEPSGQIVGNIVFKKAPLHDGAMIIRDGMIHAAGCILPLTKNASVSAELGTRHRAALGVSEESDAVVVVVSEETGQISVAVNGVLARRFTRDTLRDVLESYLIPQEEKTSTVRRGLSFLRGKRAVKK